VTARIVLGAVCAVSLFAQTPPVSAARSAAQEAYRAWRLVDPNLEADAANNPATLGVRSDRVAAEAAKYFAARQAYLEALRNDLEHTAAQFEEGQVGAEPFEATAALSGASSSVTSNLAAISNNADAGLRDLKRALERERAALAAVSSASKDSRENQSKLAEAEKAASAARMQLAARFHELASGVARESEQSHKIAADWANYYRSLASAAREGTTVSVVVPKPVPLPELAPAAPQPSSPAPVRAPAPEPATAAVKLPPEPVTIQNPALGAIRSTAPGAPSASRYVGDWIYPTVNEHYHGARPSLVEMSVREEGSEIKGTFHVKFRLPPGSTVEPDVKLTFGGPYQSAHSQSLPLTMADGTKGTFEMIPATTFNLLEVSFVTAERPGKINRGNFFVIRK